MYVRFVRPNKVSGMKARDGFFCAAYDLRDDAHIDQFTSDQLEDLLSWFRQYLTIPRKFSRSRSKGGYRGDTKGLSWFKPEAKEALEKSYELIALLAENGYVIETIKSDRVGYVVYEDENQLVAEPFSDTPA